MHHRFYTVVTLLAVGLLAPVPESRIVKVGNAAIDGARAILLSRAKRDALEQLVLVRHRVGYAAMALTYYGIGPGSLVPHNAPTPPATAIPATAIPVQPVTKPPVLEPTPGRLAPAKARCRQASSPACLPLAWWRERR